MVSFVTFKIREIEPAGFTCVVLMVRPVALNQGFRNFLYARQIRVYYKLPP
jgi:hypothetical protein